MQHIEKNHAICQIGYHIIWCPKYRKCILEDILEIELKKILSQICIEYDWKIQALEIMPDHVHIFVQTDHMTTPLTMPKH